MQTEIVVYRGEAARRSHRTLFSLPDACYVDAGESITDAVAAVSCDGLSRLHIAAAWEDMLRVALWCRERPSKQDVFGLMRRASVSEAELAPFRDADINDIFPSLYYGKRFDILRKICHAAKAKVESKLTNRKLLVNCHLVAEDTGCVVASNL